MSLSQAIKAQVRRMKKPKKEERRTKKPKAEDREGGEAQGAQGSAKAGGKPTGLPPPVSLLSPEPSRAAGQDPPPPGGN